MASCEKIRAPMTGTDIRLSFGSRLMECSCELPTIDLIVFQYCWRRLHADRPWNLSIDQDFAPVGRSLFVDLSIARTVDYCPHRTGGTIGRVNGVTRPLAG
jgi:hypothetical protein